MSDVVVVGTRRASAEAVAAMCRRRGLAATAAVAQGTLPPGDTLLVDVTSGCGVLDLVAASSGSYTRIVALGSDVDATWSWIDAWVRADATIDALVATIRSTDGRPAAAVQARLRNASTVRLTQREEQVLEELLAGGSTPEVAARLEIAPQTFRTHVQNILAKLGVNSRAQAAVWALQHGLQAAGSGEQRAS